MSLGNLNVLSVFMSDTAVAERVGKGLAQSAQGYLVEVLTAPEQVSRKDYVLTDEEMLTIVRRRRPHICVFCIGKSKPYPPENVVYLNPFWGAKEMNAVMQPILNAYDEEDLRWNFRNVITVTAPWEGLGCSAIATSLAKCLHMRSSRPVLYLSLEAYIHGTSYFNGINNDQTLEKMLLDLKVKKKPPEWGAFSRKDPSGVEYLASNGQYNELIKNPEWLGNDDLLSCLSGAVRNGFVIVDAPGLYGKPFESVLNHTNLLIQLENGSERMKYQNEQILRQIDDSVKRKYEVVRIENLSRPHDVLEVVPQDGDVVIPYDPDSFQRSNGELDLSIHGVLGNEVSELVERILERERNPEGTLQSYTRFSAEAKPDSLR